VPEAPLEDDDGGTTGFLEHPPEKNIRETASVEMTRDLTMIVFILFPLILIDGVSVVHGDQDFVVMWKKLLVSACL
jgi:hypothetical protein